MSRTSNVIKNSFFGIASKGISLILNFLSRTVFIYCLGKTLLGVNSLYTEILSILSFAELGFGSAMVYAMYSPVAENDEEKIKQLLSFYKKIYRIIAGVIAILGIALIPFLPYLVKGADILTLQQLRLYYVIFLCNTVVSYFVTYKYNFVYAQEKNYIISTVDMVTTIVTLIAQTIVLLVCRNFLAYLLTHFGILILSRFAISIYLNKKFTLLKTNPEQALPKEDKRTIYKEVKALALHQFASAAIYSTDNIIISSLSGLGVVAVGLVSNYNLIINGVLAFALILFTSSASSFGNLVAKEDGDGYRKAFLELNFLNFWVYGFCAIAFFVLVPRFITLWLGETYFIDNISFLLIVINCYLQGQSTAYHNARIAKGNFGKDKWISLVQAVVNLVVSIIGAMTMGLAGVYIGTVVSRVIFVIFRPMTTYKFLFNKSAKEYYFRLVLYFVITFAVGALTWWLCKTLLLQTTILNFIIATIIVAIIPNIVFFLLFFRTSEFKNLLQRARGILRRKVKNG